MHKIHYDIFKAIHEGKWLKIEYRNKGEEYKLSIDQIMSSEVVEGSYCPINKKLVEDIYLYKTLFENTATCNECFEYSYAKGFVCFSVS